MGSCGLEKDTVRTFYVDSIDGNDNNEGTSDTRAWKSLERVNQTVYKAGDKILFRAGTEYFGQFEPKGSGSKKQPIIVDTYDEGAKPILNGCGEKLQTILIENIQFWEINNIEVTNWGEKSEAGRNGVFISAWDCGDMEHIYLKGVTVRDVNGSKIKSEGGGNGIYWNCGGSEVPSRFVNLLIEDCHVYNCQRNGITGNGNIHRDNWHPSLNVVIRGNLIEKVPGDGIVPIACDGAIVEYNIVRGGPDVLGMEDAAAGIWPWSSDNTVIQYNEVSGHKAKWDAQGFDSDYNCFNTTIQYNFSHDNYGGMILLCNDGGSLGESWNYGTEGTTIHGNISINDGLRPYPTRPGWFSPIIHISGPTKNSVFSENIFIVFRKEQEDLDRTFICIDDWGGSWPEKTTFKNNTFYIDSEEIPYSFSLGQGIETKFQGNIFSGYFINKPIDSEVNKKEFNIIRDFDFPVGFPDSLKKRVMERLQESL